ncbi:MAG: tetratricopeptide repeat protein [Methylococcales bacterium]|nr:tetratricopeptide repeat protein [Methylococcales bacterium]
MNFLTKLLNSISQLGSIFALIAIIFAGGWALSIYEESKAPQPIEKLSIVEGENALYKGHYADAKRIFEEELRTNPENQQAAWGLKITQLKETMGHPDFKSTIDQLYEQDPNNPTINLFLGEFYLANKQLDKAIPFFEKSILENPRLAEAHNDLAQTYAHLGDFESAKIEFLNAIDVTPLPRYRNSLGAIYLKQKRYEEAIKEYGKNKEYPFSALESAKIYWRLEYLSQASNYQNQAVEWLNDKTIMGKPENQEPWLLDISTDQTVQLTSIEEKKAYAYFCLSVSLYLEGDKQGAENELRKMSEQLPIRTTHFNLLLGSTLDKLVSANSSYTEEITIYKQLFL